jgi:hypothetical protein
MDDRLERTIFSTSRAAEFLEERALQAQTGQPRESFGDVVAKEITDNGLDECEAAGVMPEIEIEQDDDYLRISDNGRGLTSEIIERVLDFDTLTTDKAAYRSPTRGLQGNALKTVLGIARVRSPGMPVLIDSLGIQHQITVSVNPAGGVAIDHTRTPSERTTGTRISVPVEPENWWARRFAVLNPHLELSDLGNTAIDERAVSYKRTVGTDWRKPLPTDRTSPHWYDEAALQKLVFSHIEASRNGHPDLPLGEFIRQFDGLSSTMKATRVAAPVGIERLSDFESRPGQIRTLLYAMWREARVLKPKVLGQVPEEHYRACLEQWYAIESGGWWFRRKALMVDDIPWAIEFALAETKDEGDCFFGVNYSPTYSDPLAGTWLEGHDDSFTGVESVLGEANAYPDEDNDYRRACVLHIVSPALEFTDKGKTRLNPPEPVVEAIGTMLRSATKDLFKERKRDQRAAAAGERRRRVKGDDHVTLKVACFNVMEESTAAVSGDGALRFSSHTLFYAVRARIQRYTDAELNDPYFSQDVLVAYQQEHGVIEGLYREPRGHLHEPHTGVSVPLGTIAVRAYVPSEWTFDKIIYVEKEGLWPTLQDAQLAERLDAAVIVGQGYAVEACREFLEGLPEGVYRIFVVHDADWHGYNIAITLSEETDRMPGYSVDVTDLGLTVADAKDLGLAPEKVTRKTGLPWRVEERLTAEECEWFEGEPFVTRRSKTHYSCLRTELNAFTGPDLISYIEQGLKREGATAKLVPPIKVIDAEIDRHHEERTRAELDAQIHELVGFEGLVSELMKATSGLKVPRGDIVKALANNPPEPWSTTVDHRVDKLLGDKLTKVAKVIVKRVAVDQLERYREGR